MPDSTPATAKAPDRLFDPRSPKWRWRLWIRLRNEADTRVTYHIFWRRIVMLLLVLAVSGWLAAAGAAWLFIRKKHGYPDVSYLNIVLPFRWDRHRESLGRYYLQQARAAVEARKPVEALRLYGAGLARQPDDFAARRELAQLYLLFRHPENALQVLTARIDAAREDRDTLRFAFALLFELQHDEEAQALARRLLANAPASSPTNGFIALQAARAALNRNHFDEVEALATRWSLDQTPEGQVLLANCDWERGYPDLAILRLEQARAAHPRFDEIPLTLLRYQRQLGRHEQALNEALIRHSADPFSPGPRVDLLYAWSQRGDRARLDREAGSFIQDFAHDPRALTLLLRFAASEGQPALARRTRDLIAAGNLPVPAAAATVAIVQACLTANQPAEALAELQQTAAAAGPEGARFNQVTAGLRSLASYRTGDTESGEIALRNFLSRENPRAADALQLAGQFMSAGLSAEAQRLYLSALVLDPQNQVALAAVVTGAAAQRDQATLARYTPDLLQSRKPSRPALTAALAALDPTDPAQEPLHTSIRRALETMPVSASAR